MLPMLPLYLSYFAVQDHQESKRDVLLSSFQFILGFTFVFSLMNIFVYSLGSFF